MWVVRYWYERKDYKKAKVSCEILTSLYPSDEAFSILFSIFYKMKNFKEAILVFPSIKYPTDELYLACAEALYKIGEYELAEKAYIKAKGTLTLGISFSYIKLGKLDLALSTLKEQELDDNGFYLVSQLAEKLGDKDEEIKGYRGIIDNFPKSPLREEAFFKLGTLYLKQGSITEAMTVCNSMVDEYPKTSLTLNLLYTIGEATGDEKYLEKIVGMYPEFPKCPDILYKIGRKQKDEGRYKESLVTFERLVKEYPKSSLFPYALYNTASLYRKLGNPKKAKTIYRGIPKISKELGEKVLLYSSNISFNLKDYTGTIEDCKTIINEYPKGEFSDDATYLMAWCYYKKEDYGSARKWFYRCLSKYPESPYCPPSIYWLGMSYFMEERYGEAREAFSRLQSQHPTHYLSEDGWIRIGLCYFNEGKYKEAQEAYQKLVEKPSSPFLEEVLYQIGECFIKQRKINGAINYYKLFIEKSKNKEINKKLSLRICELYYQDGNKRLARKGYEKFLLEYPTSEEISNVYYWIGRTYLPDSPSDAIVYFRKVNELYPKSSWAPDASFRIGVILYESGDYKGAYDEFRQLIENYKERKDLIKEAKVYIAKIKR
ncbi:TPA: hypothetical protein DCX16_04960 [bacterium]|nr:hypothetical protein [bacterium]